MRTEASLPGRYQYLILHNILLRLVWPGDINATPYHYARVELVAYVLSPQGDEGPATFVTNWGMERDEILNNQYFMGSRTRQFGGHILYKKKVKRRVIPATGRGCP
jgi:hypothetical protein